MLSQTCFVMGRPLDIFGQQQQVSATQWVEPQGGGVKATFKAWGEEGWGQVHLRSLKERKRGKGGKGRGGKGEKVGGRRGEGGKRGEKGGGLMFDGTNLVRIDYHS